MGLLNPLRLFTSHFRKIPTAGSSCRLGVVPTTNYSPNRHGKPGEGGEGGGAPHTEAALQQLTFVARAENNQKLFSDFSSDTMLPNSYCLTFNPAHERATVLYSWHLTRSKKIRIFLTTKGYSTNICKLGFPGKEVNQAYRYFLKGNEVKREQSEENALHLHHLIHVAAANQRIWWDGCL